MKRTTSAVLYGILTTLLLAGASFGQQSATGVPPFSSWSGGQFDSVNLANLDIHFQIPIFHKAGRGLPFNYDLSYDSFIWTPTPSAGSSTWTPAANWGWIQSSFANVGVVNMWYDVTNCTQNGFVIGDTWQEGFTYTDSQGTVHAINGELSGFDGNCSGPIVNSFKEPLTDGSGLTVSVNGSADDANATVTTPDGLTLSPPVIGGSNPTTSTAITDRNGNQITSNGSGQFTDTVGMSNVLSIAGSAPTTTYSYIDPSGNTQHVIVNYVQYSVQTNFGCMGVSEYGPTNNYLIDNIQLPDGTSYRFSYEATPGISNKVTGRIASVTLPTGGIITYTYSSPGVNCVDGSTNSLTRTESTGGEWTYLHWLDGASSSTNMQDAAGNATDLTFQNGYEILRQNYQGADSGALLQTIQTCYNDCNSPVSTPITQRTVNLKLPNGMESQSVTKFDANAQVIETDAYDFGNNAPGNLLRQEKISYDGTLGLIVDRPHSVQLYDGSGSLASQTDYKYDENTLQTSGAPQHISISVPRGNLTTLTQYSTIVNNTSSGPLSQHFTYYDTGTIYSSQDVNGATTTYGYMCNASFPAQVTQPLGLSTSEIWDCNGGVVTSSTDMNTNVTHYYYDLMWRPHITGYPDNGQTTIDYHLTSSPPNVTLTKLVNSDGSTETKQTNLDGFSRPVQQILTTNPPDPAGPTYIDTSYNAVGEVQCVTNPFRSTLDQTYNSTCSEYDALGRTTQIFRLDGTGRSMTYSGRATEVQDEGNGSHHVTRIYQNDGLGRLTSVCEVTSASQLGNGGTPAPCAQDIAATGFLTTYGYDTLGDLISVAQPGVSNRTYSYDALSRLTSETNPESAATNYTYDSCSAGDLCTRVRPSANQTNPSVNTTTSYSYDPLHRPLTIGYSDSTPALSFTYDNVPSWASGAGMTNSKGNLVLINNSYMGSSNGTLASAILNGYDPMGRINRQWQQTPSDSPNGYFLNDTYDLAGDLTSASNPLGNYSLTYQYNASQELTSVTSTLTGTNHPGTLFTGNQYNALGELEQATLGNGIIRNVSYDVQGRPIAQADSAAGTPYTPATGSIALSGNEQSTQIQTGDSGGPGSPNRATIIQTASADETTDTMAFVPLSPTAQGNTIVVIIGGTDQNNSVSAVTDTSSNSYVQAPGAYASSAGDGYFSDIWYCTNCNSGVEGVFVVLNNSAGFVGAAVYEVAGLATSSFDAAANLSNGTVSGGNCTGASISASASDVLFAFGDADNGFNAVNAPWTYTTDGTQIAYDLNAGAGSYQPVFATGAGSANCLISEAAFKVMPGETGYQGSAIVQSAIEQNNGASVNTTINPSGAGNNIIAIVVGGGPISNVSDNASNSYVQASGASATATLSGSSMFSDIWYCTTCTAGTTNVSATSAGSTYTAMAVYEVSGLAASPFDVAHNLSNGSAANGNCTGPSISVAASDVLFAWGNSDYGTYAVSWPWTFAPDGSQVAYDMAAGPGTYQPIYTELSGNAGCMVSDAAFKIAGIPTYETVYDNGSVTVTVNGTSKTENYSQSSTTATLAAALAADFTNDQNSPVTASASGGTINFTTRQVGTGLDYSVSCSSSTGSQYFSSSSFGCPASSSLSGGGGSEAQSQPYTPATGTVTINTNSSDRSTQVQTYAGSPGRGTIVVQGNEQSFDDCAVHSEGNCPVYDTGNVSVTVGPVHTSVGYGEFDDTISVASSLASHLNGATLSVSPDGNGNVIIQATSPGSATNYAISTSSTDTFSGFQDPSYSPYFPQPSFYTAVTPAGTTSLTGGTDPTYSTNYDTGIVTVTVDGYSKQESYSQSTTPIELAAALASDFSNDTNSPVTADANGTSTITFTSKQIGAVTNNYGLSCSSATNNSNFTSTSFPCGTSGGTLSGGSGSSSQGTYSYALQYAPNGNILTSMDSVYGQTSYAYDDFNRLSTSNQVSGSAFNYQYDRFGNRWQQNLTAGSGPAPNYSFNSNNQINGFTYDAAGNIINDGNHTYTYDAEERMIAVDGGTTATYSYDAMGRRFATNVGGTQQEFLFDLANRVLAMQNAATHSWDRGEIYAGGMHLATYVAQDTYFVHANWLGTVQGRTNSQGAIAQGYTSLPFGDSLSQVGMSPTHFTDQDRDSETGLDHFLYRQYSSTQGRWMTPDPGGLGVVDPTNPQSWNRYAYVMNNPINLIDLVGLECYAWDNGQCTSWGSPDGGNPALLGGLGDPFQVMPLNIVVTTYTAAKPISTRMDELSKIGSVTLTLLIPGWTDVVVGTGLDLDFSSLLNSNSGTTPSDMTGASPPTTAHCLGQALKKNEVALSLDAAGVAAGFLPGGDAVVAVAGIAISTTGAVYSGLHKDAPGVALNTAAFGVSALTPTAKAIGGDFAKALPVVGVFISGIGVFEDSLHVHEDYQACMAGAQ